METMKNSNLTKAKKAKNDEFFTQLPDIENELKHYKDHFKDKIVYCNCDDHRMSNFFRYFSLNFEFLGLKKLISTHFDDSNIAYKLEITKDQNGDGKIDYLDTIETPLKQNGDFRSDEAIELLKESDIVVTNPPFSLFREFIDLMFEYDKKFLVIGSQNAITYKNCFKKIKDNEMWLGISYPKEFTQPDGSIKKFGNISWFTNLPHKKRNEPMILYRTYNEKDYSKYDNYDAIEVSKTKDIPLNYEGVMGVPITFLNSYCPEQFEIVWTTDRGGDGVIEYLKKQHTRYDAPVVNGKGLYKRILIKNKTI